MCLLMLHSSLRLRVSPHGPGEPPGTPPPAVNTSGPATIVVGEQKCCPKQTLPQFLGLTGLVKAGCNLLTASAAVWACFGRGWSHVLRCFHR